MRTKFPRLNKVKEVVASVTYWSIINAAILLYVISCDKHNKARNLKD